MTTTLAPLLLPLDAAGREYGTAQQLAARLTTYDRRVTAAMIRKWAYRSRDPKDPLHGQLPGRHDPRGPRTGTTGYYLIDAARVAAITAPDHVA